MRWRPGWWDVTRAPAAGAITAVGATIAACWGLEWLAGGASHVPPHLFYVAILLAGARFGAPGALLCGALSTVVAGPLLPDDVATHQAQLTSDWVSRGVFFCAIGLTATWLFRRFHAAFDTERQLLNAERDAALAAMVEQRAAEQRATDRERALQVQTGRQDFDARLRHAFEMAQDEPAALEVVRRTLPAAMPGLPAELLLSDSSEAHLREVVIQPGPDGQGPGCPVTTPWGCPALRTSRTQQFASSEDFDACPQLAQRAGEARSAVCVPVTFMGRALGVLHTTADERQPPDTEQVLRLEAVAAQAGATVGTLRAFAHSQVQASTDGLTGLLNRRVVDDRVRSLHLSGRPYALLLGDLDHFKQLNDRHGHETGDRALRLFSRVLRDTVREGDLVARYGGEEFLLVLPESSLDQAVQCANRIRLALAESVAEAGVPAFTASFGTTDSLSGATFEAVLGMADAALFAAKRAGRDRVEVAAPPTGGPQLAPGLSLIAPTAG